ncbi:RNA polymerase [Synechococcus phage S-SRP01]|uniref:DNA-directed RNA polymerase n=1 Tax=Synechococcus phage S-SRP01 TaxID=2781607 RepID=A0A874M889_9CAUD|nr:RNA polymerase [Synechococcus phage S-SRP01]
MSTPALIEEELLLEKRACAYGRERLLENTRKLEERSYASASVYGAASIQAALVDVAATIQDTLERIHKGHNGKDFITIHQYLAEIEPEAAAAIALKLTFDHVFSPKDRANEIANVITAIGRALEQEAQLRWYEAQDRDLYERIKRNYWHSSCGTQQKATIARTLMNRHDYHWDTWGSVVRAKLGAWLLECVMKATGWFERVTVKRHNGTPILVVPSLLFAMTKEELMKDALMFAPMAWPMLVPPRDWSPIKAGGYLLNEVMNGHEMVRRGDPTLIQGNTPLLFLNKLQKTAYTLNEFIVGVAEALMERQYKVGKFIPIIELPLPNKPWDIADNEEARHEYRRQAAEAMNHNAAAFKRSCRTRMTMETVKLFKEKDKFFLPWSFDYRGRTYPIPAFLTPQDTDFGKSLLKFAEPAFMTEEAEEWLAFQVATTYGLDKATMQERQDWVAANHDLISRVAIDALSNLSDWEVADEPWQFLAACEEYHACVIECSRSWTNLPVAVDATCSGLQILAGLARDRSTAKLVNVFPSEQPQDAYKVVAEHAKPKLPSHLAALLDRKVTKRTVMTIPYNATQHSNRAYIREALQEKGAEFTPDELTQIVSAVREAMYEVVPGPMQVMDWIKKEVGTAFKRGADHLVWQTPSGFLVKQNRRKYKFKRVELEILGMAKIKLVDYPKGPDVLGHKSSTAPNLIHSLDASILHRAFLKFDAPFTVIHDSVLCRATDMGVLNRVVRETYCEIFSESNPLVDFAEAIGAETEPPIIGDLDLESVLESTYFFC